ncbi:epimerase domain-containing protein [Haematococcus lacustris]|uniref:Epimerase domain-containing protein n=1 Tax=Haematococcus lacustris TaxID=44745 RepID=A0A699ZW89_HAELA|nr:epimerase domain-containing protein [Haematococcus lacustris]
MQWVMVDLGDRHAVMRALAHAKPLPSLVMHFAAVAYVAESMADPVLYYKNITSTTTFLLDVMRELGIKQLVYSSTCAVYGNQEVLPITELSPPKPINPYGEAKLMAERVINAAMKADSGLQAIILRYFNVYGSDPQGRLGEWPRPELRHHSRISGACLDAAMGLVPSVTIKGTQHPTADGSCVRDYVHVSDLVEAHLRAIQHLDNPAPVLNIGSGHPVSVKQFVAACKNVTGRDFKVVEQAEARQGDYAEVWAKIDRIQEAFEWSPRYTDVAEGLRHAWQWRLRHPQGYEKHSDDSMADGHDIS